MTLKTAAILATAIGALGLTAPAAASPAQSVERVAYADLDLLTPAGQAELQRRVDRAAWVACRYEEDGAMRDSQTRSRCFRESRQRVTVQVAKLMEDRPLLGG